MISLEELGVNLEYITLGLVGFSVIVLICLIVLFIKNSRLKKKYKVFMGGKEAKSLENMLLEKINDIESLKSDNKKIINKLESITENLLDTYQKLGIVKYDAFEEMGGKLSFALCLLNDKNNGFIINSMHSSREGCYSYIKEIINGESFILLAEEEKKALAEALSHNRMI